MPPDKQTVKCFHADETDSHRLKTKSVTLGYQEKQCVLLCVALSKQSRWRVPAMNT